MSVTDSRTTAGAAASLGGLRVRGLGVTLDHDGSALLDGVDLDVDRGELVAVVGSSGAGKSTLLSALLGRVPRGCSLAWSEASLDTGQGRVDLVRAGASTWQRLRRQDIRTVAQDPAAALTPLRRVEALVAESIRLAGAAPDTSAVRTALRVAGFPDPAAIARRSIHTLSGGMAQRVGVAIALAAEPTLVLADEPTTALDPVAAAAVLRALRAAADAGAAVVVVTHDLDAVEPFADRVIGLAAGRTTSPRSEGPRAARVRAPTTAGSSRPALELAGLTLGYGDRPVLADVDLEVAAGEVVGLRGPSGVGKSTLLAAVVGLVAPRAGSIRVGGVDTADLTRRQLRRQVQLVPQHPREALNPWRTATQLVREPLDIHRAGGRGERRDRARELLDQLGLGARLDARPAELSTGQCQRVCLARAVVLGPRLLLADEPVSSLDPDLAEEMLTLLADLADQHGAGVLLVSHDHARLGRVSDRVIDLTACGERP